MGQHKLLKAHPVVGIQLAQTSPRLNEIHDEEPSQARFYSVSWITDERKNRGKVFLSLE